MYQFEGRVCLLYVPTNDYPLTQTTKVLHDIDERNAQNNSKALSKKFFFIYILQLPNVLNLLYFSQTKPNGTESEEAENRFER